MEVEEEGTGKEEEVEGRERERGGSGGGEEEEEKRGGGRDRGGGGWLEWCVVLAGEGARLLVGLTEYCSVTLAWQPYQP